VRSTSLSFSHTKRLGQDLGGGQHQIAAVRAMDRSGAEDPVIGHEPAAEHAVMLDPTETLRIRRVRLHHHRCAAVLIVVHEQVDLVA